MHGNDAGAFDLASAMSERLHAVAHRHSESMLYLAVDAPAPAAAPLPEPLEAALQGPAAQPVAIRHAQVDPSLWPQWLPLNTAAFSGSRLLRLSLEQAMAEAQPDALRRGGGRRIAGWFTLDGELGTAAEHWAGQMLRRRPDGRTCLLRLHDPAVLWGLWPLLEAQQRRALMGPTTSWHLLSPAGELLDLTAGAAAAGTTGAPGGSAWSASLWQGIDDIAALNAALRQHPVHGHALASARQAALRALGRARACGFTHPQDLAAYAAHAIAVDADFDRHPAVSRLLAAAQPGQRYTELVDALSAEDWAAIQQPRL